MSLKFPKLKAANCIVAFLSSALQAFGMYNIHALSGVTEGGVLGATLLFDHWFGLSPAVSSFVLNIACYALGWKTLGRSFIAYSAIAACGYSASYAVCELFPPLWPEIASLPLLASVAGALFIGVGAGLCVRAGGATTGDDALAMSLSLQNTMANFAGGVLVLFLKPFKAGDYIVTKDGEGTVESIGLVYTTLLTIENKRIVIPNSSISNSPITNSTGEEKKKLVLNIGIGYSADLKKAKEILRRLFEEHPAILKEDGILVVVDSLGESSVNLSVRGWTLTEEYWTARWELTEAVKLAFDEEGIEIPYNYLNVHLTEKQKQSGQA